MAINVGLDIGTSAVRAAVVQTGKGVPVLQRYGQVGLPEGAVVAGEIVEEAIVRDALTQLWKTAKLPKKRVVVGIANQRVIVRRVDVPYMAEDELAQALPFQAQEYIPIPIDEAILDYVPLEEFATPNGEAMLSILVVAAQKDMAADILRVVGEVGVKVMAIDLQAFALSRAVLGADFDLDTGTQAIVNIGAGLTQVILMKGGTIRFLRMLTIGGASFTAALADRMPMEMDQAEQYKRRTGVAIDAAPAGGEGEALARSVLTEEADILIEEIRGSVDYYLSQSGGDTLDRLFVAGNGARLPNLANRLGRSLGVGVQPVRVLDEEKMRVGKLGLSDVELAQAQPVLPVPVGLAMWGEL
ncbi:MAG: type IV pilus assembly protein PilM [Acidimicrobiia bacterium]|nr:type IV pilus assembly protein PilM [Acidimicrobiia bacterium]